MIFVHFARAFLLVACLLAKPGRSPIDTKEADKTLLVPPARCPSPQNLTLTFEPPKNPQILLPQAVHI